MSVEGAVLVAVFVGCGAWVGSGRRGCGLVLRGRGRWWWVGGLGGFSLVAVDDAGGLVVSVGSLGRARSRWSSSLRLVVRRGSRCSGWMWVSVGEVPLGLGLGVLMLVWCRCGWLCGVGSAGVGGCWGSC